MNYASAYVIGLTPFHLLDIEHSLYFVRDFTDTELLISRITHGFHNLYDVTLIPDLETAKDLVKQIQQRYDEIAVYNNNILETVIEGTNDFDPNKLHIYEVNIGMEVT
jgi:hypothetical protein